MRLVDTARMCPSAANKQPLKYVLVNTPEVCATVFPFLKWAGYLKEWPGPAENERPSAYIIVLGDTEITKDFGCDHGIAAQTIMLCAAEEGLAGCIAGSIARPAMRKELGIPTRFEILLVLALGKPAEKVVIEHLASGDDIKYWRDKQQVHHVPKRSLRSVVVDIEAAVK
jgi:nitroreductase